MIIVNSLTEIPEEEGFIITTAYNYLKITSKQKILDDLKDFVTENLTLKKSDIANVYFLADATSISSMPFAVIITVKDEARGIRMSTWDTICARFSKYYKKLSNERPN